MPDIYVIYYYHYYGPTKTPNFKNLSSPFDADLYRFILGMA